MPDELGLIDVPEVGGEVETPETPEVESTETQPEQQTGESDKKFSERFSKWLQTTRDSATDPEIQKFARYGKDLEGRDRALRELYPNGVNSVREVKAVLDGLQFGDHKGVEAIGAIQDQIRDYEQSDELLASGDPKVLSLFGPEFDEGLGKLTPALLDRLQQSSPQAYSAAILPHLVSSLVESPMIHGLGQISAVLNEKPPSWLTPDQKTSWINDKFEKIVNSFNSVATWWDAQIDASKNAPKPVQNGQAPQAQADPISAREQAIESRERQIHWDTNIHPQTTTYGNNSFQELFKPYAGRLKLDEAATTGLRNAFMSGVVKKLAADRNYMSQLERYQRQRNPDPKMVVNLANVNFEKHAKGVLNELIQERYRPFLGSKQNPTPRATNGTFAANGTGPRVVSVKPNPAEIDFHNTPVDWLNTKADGSKQYMMKDGKTVIFRPNR